MSCPFCDGELEINEIHYWTGMRYNILSYTGRHNCNHEEEYDRMSITIRGKTKEDVERIWNRRVNDI